MPEAAFGKRLNLPSNSGTFVQLSQKGDTIKFCIANTPHYETVHWINKEKILCEKFNGEDKEAFCGYCDEYKKLKDAGRKKDAEAIQPTTNFYYPVLNLTEVEKGKPANTASIFQFKAKSIHYNINGYAEKGVDVFDCVWMVERTEEKGNYYPVFNLGPKKLTKEQEAILETAKNLKIKAVKESSSVVLQDESEAVASEE